MINKDFLRMILVEEKKLLTLEEKREVNVPKYDELSVNLLYPKFKNDARFMAYFPDTLPKGRWPDRKYFFNVMNTLYPEYTQTLVQTANNNRCLADDGEGAGAAIHVSEEWWAKLNAMPHMKCKYFFDY